MLQRFGYRIVARQGSNGKIWFLPLLLLLLGISSEEMQGMERPDKKSGSFAAQVFTVNVVQGVQTFRIPYKGLNVGDCFRLVSRNSDQWMWNGNTRYEGKISTQSGTAGFFDGIPLPENIESGYYPFDLMVGITLGGEICYSDPVPVIVWVRAIAGSRSDTVCSGSRVAFMPECIEEGKAGKEDYFWQRAAVEGIRETAAEGVGGIDEVLTNMTYKPVKVRYVYTVKPNDCFPEVGFELIVVVNPTIAFEVVNNKIELCDGESTDIAMKPDIPDLNYTWNVEMYGVTGAWGSDGKQIYQELHYDEAPATVLYRISAQSAAGENVCSEEQTTVVRVKPLPEIHLNWNDPMEKVILGNPICIQAYPEYYDKYWFSFNGINSEQKGNELKCYDWYEGRDNRVTVTVVSDEGCSRTDSLVIRGPELKLPNVITPNGDGVNDRLFHGFELEVFNRNGSQLYKGKDGWDGIYQGQPVPVGTYLYVVHYISPEGKKIMKKYHVYVDENR